MPLRHGVAPALRIHGEVLHRHAEEENLPRNFAGQGAGRRWGGVALHAGKNTSAYDFAKLRQNGWRSTLITSSFTPRTDGSDRSDRSDRS